MRKLMKQVEKAARIVNLPHLVKKKMTEKEARFLYTSTRHLFLIPSEENKTRRYETLSWKSYYNLLSKRKWRLFGEKSEVPVEQGETVKQRKQRKKDRTTTRKRRRIPKAIQVTQELTEESDFLKEFAAIPPPT